MALNEYLKTAGLPLVSVVISVQVSATTRDAGEYFAENLEQKIDEKMANLVICVSLGRKIYKLVLFLPFSTQNALYRSIFIPYYGNNIHSWTTEGKITTLSCNLLMSFVQQVDTEQIMTLVFIAKK